MQDYDLFGQSLDELTEVIKYDHGPVETPILILELRRFLLRHGNTDPELAESFRRVFQPELCFEGWDGRTLRQSLERMLEILQDPNHPGHAMPD